MCEKEINHFANYTHTHIKNEPKTMAIVNENLFRSIPRTTNNCKQNDMIKCELLNEKKNIFFLFTFKS